MMLNRRMNTYIVQVCIKFIDSIFFRLNCCILEFALLSISLISIYDKGKSYKSPINLLFIQVYY